MLCCLNLGCAPKIYVPNVKHIMAGEPSPITGYVLTENDLKALGDIRINNSK